MIAGQWSGKRLTFAAQHLYGIERKRWFWIFQESDRSLRKRCLELHKYPTHEKPAGCRR